MHEPEQLVIRPPSEARSLLVRLTRGCNWNRCLFCGIYDLFGTPYSTRTAEEVKLDIDALAKRHSDRFKTAFLGDANPLDMPAGDLVDILRHLKMRFPNLERVTAYGRASSIWKKTDEELNAIRAAGLDRLHIGMESGSDDVLKLQKKGTSSKQLIEAGRRARAAGFEVSFYLLLGLGGQALSREHIDGSVRVINEAGPDFVRVRRLWVHPASRLNALIESGEFKEQTPEGTVVELREILSGLACSGTYFTCDHANNYIQVHGELMKDKPAMMGVIENFLRLPEAQRKRHYESMPSVI
ncbi:MAG TPA: radical SAM protein [Desulfomonilia bacterium]